MTSDILLVREGCDYYFYLLASPPRPTEIVRKLRIDLRTSAMAQIPLNTPKLTATPGVGVWATEDTITIVGMLTFAVSDVYQNEEVVFYHRQLRESVHSSFLELPLITASRQTSLEDIHRQIPSFPTRAWCPAQSMTCCCVLMLQDATDYFAQHPECDRVVFHCGALEPQ